MATKIMYILLNAKGERLYQYAPTEYMDVAERYRHNWYEKHGTPCRIATIEVDENHVPTKAWTCY